MVHPENSVRGGLGAPDNVYVFFLSSRYFTEGNSNLPREANRPRGGGGGGGGRYQYF